MTCTPPSWAPSAPPVLALLGLLACAEPTAPSAAPGSEGALAPATSAQAQAGHAAAPSAEPRTVGAAERTFGAALTGDMVPVSLASLLDEPERYTGQVVQTEGEVSAVCQRMGCWMELRDERARAVRVPMAGHAFFLPPDAAGRRALVEGALSVRPLGAAEREHLASEGAAATDVALEINATSVVVRASGAQGS
jgi:hypothetical protein